MFREVEPWPGEQTQVGIQYLAPRLPSAASPRCLMLSHPRWCSRIEQARQPLQPQRWTSHSDSWALCSSCSLCWSAAAHTVVPFYSRVQHEAVTLVSLPLSQGLQAAAVVLSPEQPSVCSMPRPLALAGSLGCGSSLWPALRTNHVTGHTISMMRSVEHLQERTMSGSRSSMLFVAVCHTEDSLGPHGLVDPELKPQTLASLPA